MNEQGGYDNYNIHEICCDIINFNESIIDIENTYQEEYRSLLVEEVMNESVKDNLSKAWKAIKKFFSDLWEKIKNLFNKIISSISKFISKLMQKFKKMTEIIKLKKFSTFKNGMVHLNLDIVSIPKIDLAMDIYNDIINTYVDILYYEFKDKIDINSYKDSINEITLNLDKITKDYLNIETSNYKINIEKVDSDLTHRSKNIILDILNICTLNIIKMKTMIDYVKSEYNDMNKIFTNLSNMNQSEENYKKINIMKDSISKLNTTINTIVNRLLIVIKNNDDTVNKIMDYLKAGLKDKNEFDDFNNFFKTI